MSELKTPKKIQAISRNAVKYSRKKMNVRSGWAFKVSFLSLREKSHAVKMTFRNQLQLSHLGRWGSFILIRYQEVQTFVFVNYRVYSNYFIGLRMNFGWMIAMRFSSGSFNFWRGGITFWFSTEVLTFLKLINIFSVYLTDIFSTFQKCC
jgi:hypothetical protein